MKKLYIKNEKDGLHVKGDINPYWFLELAMAIVDKHGGTDEFIDLYEKEQSERTVAFNITGEPKEDNSMEFTFEPELDKEDHVLFAGAILLIIQQMEV